jgi:hypothetical protein
MRFLTILLLVAVFQAHAVFVTVDDVVPMRADNGNLVSDQVRDGVETESSPPAPPRFGPQSSTKHIEWGFDFVERFDGLQDWAPNFSGGFGYTWDMTRMPKLANGTPGAWSFYTGQASTAKWIGGVADGKQVWRGTKSATIDMGGPSPRRGPNRLGLFFGDPDAPGPGQGYDSVRVFYMLWIPRAHFPTSCTNGCSTTDTVGVYTEGSPYTYFAYYKLGNINHGCDDSRCPRNDTYGEIVTVISILRNSYTSPSGAPPGLFLAESPRGQNNPTFARAGPSNLDAKIGQWWGVEMWMRTNDENTGSLLDMWTYTDTGVAEHVLVDAPYTFGSAAGDRNWDSFVLGGNNVWTWGPTMDAAYYVDDFIVDDGSKGQIGPRYFAAIAGE